MLFRQSLENINRSRHYLALAVLVLEKTEQFPDPAWRVIWGESVGHQQLFRFFVDASTGKSARR